MQSISPDTNYIEFDAGMQNNVGSNIKVRNLSIYFDPDRTIDDEYIKDRIASELGYEGVGTYSVYAHDPDLKIGDQIPTTAERLHLVSISISNKTETHEAILQTLNREIGGYCFPVDAFTNSVDAWSGIPVIYADDHPDMALFDEDQAAALEQISGEIVGSINKPHIATDGHPRLMGQLKNKNQSVAELITAGKASISTGFRGTANEKKQIVDVVPNHVLIFKEDSENMPKDHGAFILNKTDYIEFMNAGEILNSNTSHITDINTKESTNMEEVKELSNKLEIANKELGSVASKLDIANKRTESLNTTIEEQKTALEVANKESDTQKTTIEAHETKIKEFEQKEADTLAAKRDSEWDIVKANLPVGLTHKEDDDKALRSEWESDGQSFSAKYLPMAQKIPGTGESGAEHTSTGDNKSGATTGVFTPGKGYVEG